MVHPTRLVPTRAPRVTWRGWTALVLGSATPLSGCYTTRPVTAPVPGAVVVLALNDRGRLALGERIGPSASRIEGVVQERSDTSYAIRISSVAYLSGQSNKWSGEPFTVPMSFVSGVQQREYSHSRTLALGGGIAAVLLTVILRTNFFGKGGNESDPRVPPGGSS